MVRDALGNETRYEYDAANRRTAMVDALGQRTEYIYDDYDRLVRTTFADGTYKETEYDLAGRKTAEIDQEGKRTEFAYDAVGNLTSVSDAMGFVTSYTYDDNNNRISQTDANNHTTTMEYDKLNRLTKRIYPNGDQERFGFDANGNMTYKVSGVDSTAFVYDSRNRETFRWYSNSGHTVETKYTVDSKRDTVIDHRGITDYDYNSDGRLEVVTNPDNTFIQYGYDLNGNKTEMTTPWGTTLYSFDQLNRMKMVTSSDNAVTEYFYNAVGNRDSISHANGTSVGYDYDNLNRLTKVTNYAHDTSVISSFTYELNNAGIRTAVIEADGSRVDYGYDDLYRLTGETRTGSNAYSIAYTYDNAGNRVTKDHDGVVTTYTYNNRDQLTSEISASETITYTYDGSGRTATKTDNSGLTTYGWADNDRMVSVGVPLGTVTYTYDAAGNKVAVDDGIETKYYLVDMIQPYAQVITEYDNTSNATAEYVYGLERISQDRAGVVNVFLADGLGSVRELTDGAGNVTDTYSYLAFGEEFVRTGTTENNFKFVGEEIDPNSGFSYNRARWYNMSNGRFVSVDPFAGKRTLPISLHRYLYSNQSPISMKDPSGEVTIIECMATVAISGILATNIQCSPPAAILLSKKSFTPSIGMNGEFSWNVKWHLSSASRKGGFIIQTVTHTVNVNGGIYNNVSGTITYQEAWEVKSGKRVTTLGSTFDDCFRSKAGGYGVGTQGTYEIMGTPIFYEGLKTLPPDFKAGGASEAGNLLSTYTIHSSFSGRKSNTVGHWIYATWNSSSGKNSPTNIVGYN